MDSIASEIQRLTPIVETLKTLDDAVDRLEFINGQPSVQAALQEASPLRTFMQGLAPGCEVAMKSVILIGQKDVVFRFPDEQDPPFDQLRVLLHQLLQCERFYFEMGGIVGYHLTVLELMSSQGHPADDGADEMKLLEPPGKDLSSPTKEVREAILEGIRRLGELGELYPVGGAGDRLSLLDESNGEALPAAKLPFLGRSLVSGLIRDLQAREYLHYKIYGQQICTPVAMMTSQEKSNHRHIEAILEQNRYYGRPKESFSLFTQPLTPVVTEEGNWGMSAALQPCLKPGGHGVLWKVARDAGVFDSFKESGHHRVLVRQVNNPLAGVDYGLLAFTGTGLKEDKVFGFASCRRRLYAAEGMNVLELRKGKFCLTNLEYTDFAHWGVEDEPKVEGEPYSRFPSNTNILFANLDTVSHLIDEHPLPGLLLNMKTKCPYLDSDGHERELLGGRLESTMQNIADYLTADTVEDLPTFLTYNHRHKTISVTKKSYTGSGEIWETPVGCLYEILSNSHALLKGPCGMDVPNFNTPEDYVENGPSLFFLYHPALGPLYSIIAQKLRGGRLAKGSELQLEIAEVDIENLQLDGSLYIHAQQPLGSKDAEGITHYGEGCGKCTLKNVTVTNDGIDPYETSDWWKNRPLRTESLRITLKGNGEFFAENVSFQGDHRITVADGVKMTAYEEDGKLCFKEEKIEAPSWFWAYQVDQDSEIQLTRRDLSERTRPTKGQPSQLAS